MKTPPSIPQEDAQPETRADQLDAARADYVYDDSYQDVVLSEHLAEGENFELRYTAFVAGLYAKQLGNRIAIGAKRGHDVDGDGITDVKERFQLLKSAVKKGGFPSERVGSFEDFEALYPKLGLPVSAQFWREDWYFAWQRLAGGNPIEIALMREIPDNLPLTDAHLRAATSADDSLAAALAEHRLFVCDFAILDGLECGEINGWQKYLWAPLAVFAVRRGAGGPKERFVPVAIQCHQRPGPDNPLWTPRDGIKWEMAKCCVQTADAHTREIGAHTALCHLIMESVLLASHRELAANHPILRLLGPHLAMTQATNEVMKNSFIGPDGFMVNYQSPTLEGAFTLIHRTLNRFDLSASDLAPDLAARGVDDAEVLPWYPYRDDALPIMDALLRWAAGYLEVYYADDEAVRNDAELQKWVIALGDPDGGKLRGIPEVATREALRHLVASLIWRSTAFHSVINYTGWEFLGWLPNQPTAAFGPGPSATEPNTEQDFINMFPPLDVTVGVQEVMYQLGHSRANRLGDYDMRAFGEDPQVKAALERFQSDLAEIFQLVQTRNAERPVPYIYLDPATVPASIHV